MSTQRFAYPRNAVNALLALLAAALTLATAGAQAQAAAPRYTYRALPNPASALECGYQGYGVPLQINQSGTVVGACQFVKGYTTVPNLAKCGFTNTLCHLFNPLLVPVRYPMLVQWPANGGAPRVLSLPSGQDKRTNTAFIGLTDSGDVYASSMKTDSLGRATAALPYQVWLWKGQGGAPSLVTPPASLSKVDHELLQVTKSGRKLWRAQSKSLSGEVNAQQVVISAPDAPDRLLQSLPASAGAEPFGFDFQLNDLGHVLQARLAKRTDNTFETEFWFDQGQGWQLMPSLGGRVEFAYFEYKGLSNMDTLPIQVDGKDILWSLREPAVKQPLPSAFYLGMSPQGALGGSYFPGGSASYIEHGMVVLNDVLYDLNEVTSGLPAGWVVQKVHSINDKGQVVVEMRDSTKKPEERGKAIRMALLTPQ